MPTPQPTANGSVLFEDGEDADAAGLEIGAMEEVGVVWIAVDEVDVEEAIFPFADSELVN